MVVAQLLRRVQLFVTPWTAARQASLSFTTFRSLLKFMSIESVMPSNHLIFCVPFSSCLQSFPALGSFSMSQLFTSGGQIIGASASASVPPMDIWGSFPLGLPCGSDGKVSACNVGESGSISGLGRPPGEGNDNPLQYPCLENPTDGGAW